MSLRALNVAAMALALVLAMASSLTATVVPLEASEAVGPARDVRLVTRADGSRALLDAGDRAVPLRPYRRIVAGSTVADELLLALCEPDRVVGVTVYSAEHAPEGYRFAGQAVHGGLANLEQILALQPDLVITNHIGDLRVIERLRERGIEVFDLGPMRGMRTLTNDVREVGWLIGAPERAAAFGRVLERRMRRIARGLPEPRRKRALYVSSYGDKLYGGTLGTSYHDVLSSAGLVDVAATAWRDWPAYTAEDLLTLAPERIVTSTGMAMLLCRHAGLSQLPACREPGAVIELDAQLMQSAGPSMVDAAEELFERVYEVTP